LTLATKKPSRGPKGRGGSEQEATPRKLLRFFFAHKKTGTEEEKKREKTVRNTVTALRKNCGIGRGQNMGRGPAIKERTTSGGGKTQSFAPNGGLTPTRSRLAGHCFRYNRITGLQIARKDAESRGKDVKGPLKASLTQDEKPSERRPDRSYGKTERGEKRKGARLNPTLGETPSSSHSITLRTIEKRRC